MTNTNTARAKFTESRRKMAAAVMAHTGAKLDDTATIVSDKIVLSGSVIECALVAAHFAETLLVDGVELDEPMAEDPDWTCVRIPCAGLTAALAKHAA
jgi:hypothetical protein